MRKIITYCALTVLSCFYLTVAAQTPGGKITGKVGDGNQAAVAAATVSLLKAKDSAVVKMSMTGKDGLYEFENIPEGKYLLLVSAVGHVRKYGQPFALANGQTYRAAVLELTRQNRELGAVTVTAVRPPVEQKIDRMVVNVEASVTNAGSTAMDVLEKSPGIQVDRDGNISLKGKQGVIVMMDGRPTYLGAADLANLLRSMPASQLDQIEIMTNPPAKFDASGNSGVINIKTKKNKQFGYNGSVSVSYGQGVYHKQNGSVNFNYRNKKINFFSSFNHDASKGFNDMDIQRNFRDLTTKELTSNFMQEARMKFEPAYYGARIEMDYFASKKTTFGVAVNGFINPRTNINRNVTDISDESGNFEGQTRAISASKAQWKNLGANLNFRHLIDTSGSELTADFDYVVYDSWNNQSLVNSYFDEAGNTTEKTDTLLGDLPQQITIYSGRVDYVLPLKKGARFEAGLKTSFVKTDNNAIYDSVSYGEIVHDLGRSNHFIYEENINAAYVNLSAPISKKWSGQVGLRLENTHATGDQLTTGEKFDRNYTQLFPTAYLQYTLDKRNTFVLNYGRRIRRPDYESLNPFINFLDRYTYQQGNPNLKPQFSHNIELSHTWQRYITTTINYFRTTDIIQSVLEQNEEKNETFVRRSNIAKQRQIGISVSANHPITKWWRSSIYVNVFENKYEGIVNNSPISVTAATLALNGSQQFNFAKTWSAEISGFYRTAAVEGVLGTRPMGMVAAGIGKQVLKGKGTIRVNVRDLFYTQRFKGYSRYSNVDTEIRQVRDSRVVTLSLMYRFSKGKMNGSQRKRTNSSNDEINRVNVGN